jgi:hypothetical protein
MASYMDYAVENADQTGMLLGKAADAIMGVEDEEAAVDRLIRNSDMETKEGRDALLKAVGKISPDAFAELQTQMNQTAVANATTANTLMNSENQLIAHKQKIFGGKYAREFERQAGPNGEGFAIHYFLQKNDITFVPEQVKTIAQAEALIKKHMGKDSNYKGTQKQLNSYVGEQRQLFITMRATQDAGVEMTSGSSETSATPNNFDATIPGDTSGADTTSTGNSAEQRASDLEETRTILNELIAKVNAGDNSPATLAAVTENQAKLQELLPSDFDRLSDWRQDSNVEAEKDLKTVLTKEGVLQKVPKHYIEIPPGSGMWVPGKKGTVTADQMTDVFDF